MRAWRQLQRIGGAGQLELRVHGLGRIAQRAVERAVDADLPGARRCRCGAGALAPARRAAARRSVAGSPRRRRATAARWRAGAPARRRSTAIAAAARCRDHDPRPRTRPARLALVGQAARRAAGSRCDRAGWACRRARAALLRTGTRPLSQRPGSRFCTRTDACAGRSSPALCTVACASMRVRGAALLSAARSSARVDNCSDASGQSANGSMRAETSSRRRIGVAFVAAQAGAHA